MSTLPGKLLFKQSVELRFGEHLGEFLNTRTTTKYALRDRAIAEHHDLLVADETLSLQFSRSFAALCGSTGCFTASAQLALR
jgi:hypothetical protein